MAFRHWERRSEGESTRPGVRSRRVVALAIEPSGAERRARSRPGGVHLYRSLAPRRYCKIVVADRRPTVACGRGPVGIARKIMYTHRCLRERVLFFSPPGEWGDAEGCSITREGGGRVVNNVSPVWNFRIVRLYRCACMHVDLCGCVCVCVGFVSLICVCVYVWGRLCVCARVYAEVYCYPIEKCGLRDAKERRSGKKWQKTTPCAPARGWWRRRQRFTTPRSVRWHQQIKHRVPGTGAALPGAQTVRVVYRPLMNSVLTVLNARYENLVIELLLLNCWLSSLLIFLAPRSSCRSEFVRDFCERPLHADAGRTGRGRQ